MREITAKEFSQLIDAETSFIVHFWAAWNQYDSDQRIILEKIQIKFQDIPIFQMNVDIQENFDICKRHNVQGPPTIVFYRSGNFVRREVGLIKEQAINEMLRIGTIV